MTANAKASAHLATLKVGAPVTIQINGNPIAARFRSYADGATKFSVAGPKREIIWAELRHLVLPNAEPVATPIMQVVRDEPAPTPEPVEMPRVGELGQSVLRVLAENKGLMMATELATALGLSMQKVAGSFVGLRNAGLIVSEGGENKKGGKVVRITVAGWEYVGVAAPAPEQAVEFACTPDHVLAMEQVGATGKEIADVFTAQLINDLDEAYTNVVVKTPAKGEGYFFATITADGMAYAESVREALDMGPRVVEEPETTPEPVKATRGRKKGQTAEVLADATIARAKTGRAGASRKSLREQVLGAFGKLADGKLGYREIVAALAATGAGLTKMQIQNVAFKLTKSGFLVADEEGRTASPLQLTKKGVEGYSTNHGKDVKVEVEMGIAAGLNNNEVALSVGCDIGYVADVRSGRGTGFAFIKRKREQAAPTV